MSEDRLPPGLWISISDLARRRGISRVSAKERVDRLEAQGLVETRRDGNKRLVELAAFDRAVGETGVAAKELAVDTAQDRGGPQARGYRDAQADRARYEAQLKALDLAERKRLVLPIGGEHGVEAATRAVAAAFTRDMDGLGRYADELATAVSKEGVAGARRILKEVGRSIRQSVADRLGELAAAGAAAERAGPLVTELPEEPTPTNSKGSPYVQ